MTKSEEGKILWYSKLKKKGFIETGEGEEIFLSEIAFKNSFDKSKIRKDAKVSFEIGLSKRGNKYAKNVRILENRNMCNEPLKSEDMFLGFEEYMTKEDKIWKMVAAIVFNYGDFDFVN
ncbi:hypothetical protein MHBO_003883 [Bonamia ostreae]|uniref:Cold-shock domain-containing protein n=1 Tax=Bonamia ostreae TaxID=126728 RepID=A0ABV2ASE9_9EUKA